MGWSESVQGCKKHPTLNQSPGVCSSCLRERLFQLSESSTNKRKTTTTIRIGPGGGFYKNDDKNFSHNSDDHSSPSSSGRGGASPARRHHRNASEAMANFLKKSRSIAVVPRSVSHRFGSEVMKKKTSFNNNIINNNNSSNGKKKGGFWSKLINGATGKRKSEVKHSMNFRESLESRV